MGCSPRTPVASCPIWVAELMLKLPHIDNPLFKIETRAVSWGAVPTRARRYSLWILALVVVVVGGLWLNVVLTTPSYVVTGYYNYSPRSANSSGFIGLIALVSILSNVVLDLASMWFTVTSLDTEQNPVRWDLLRLTDVHPEVIIAAKHAIAQLRVWRLMIAVISLRLVTIVLFLIHLIFIDNTVLNDPYFSFLLLLPTAAVFAAVYLIEPYWRLRALTMLGLSISARVKNFALAFLAGFGAIVAVWITQGIVMTLLGMIFFQLVLIVFFKVWFIGLFLACAVTGYMIYTYYRNLSARWLRTAAGRLYREG